MSESTEDSAAPSGGQASIDRRRWSHARQYRAALGLAVLVVVGASALWLWGHFLGNHGEPAAPPSPPPGTFRATPQQLKTLSIETIGLRPFVSEELTEGKIAVNGDRSTPLYSPYSGRVLRVIAGLGDTVKKSQALATVEASEFVQAQNDLGAATAQWKLAHINESRKHALFDSKGGSQQDWQQAQADLTSAEATLQSVRNRLRILGQSGAQIDALQSAHGIDPVATLAAPIGGVVVDRQVGPGQYLQAGSGTAAFTIADPTSVWLLANVREADSGSMQLGQAMEVHVPAYPTRTFHARVTYVAALVDAATHRLPVRAEIDNRDLALKPEMFASFRIITSDATEAPAVPASAVVYEGDAAHVWVLAGDGLLTYRPIHIGRANAGWLEVLQGLAAGERIVTQGALFIDQAATPTSP